MSNYQPLSERGHESSEEESEDVVNVSSRVAANTSSSSSRKGKPSSSSSSSSSSSAASASARHSLLRWTRTKVHDRFRSTDYWRDESSSSSSSSSLPRRIREGGGRGGFGGGENERISTRVTAAAARVEENEESRLFSYCIRAETERDVRHQVAKAWRRLQTVTLLLTLGVLVALITFSVDKVVHLLENARDEILHMGETSTTSVNAGGVVLYMLLSLSLSWLAVILVRFVPMAMGSGIPRMKSLFSGGVYFHYFLSWRTLFVKVTGLACAYSAGLTVGKEGPFVHIAACVATLLARQKVFLRYTEISRLRHGILSVACATGVVAAFGCPFGGIIFAIEAVSTYFVVRSLPHMFVATTAGAIVLRSLDSSEYSPLGTFSDQTDGIDRGVMSDTTGTTIVQSVVVGAVCGLLSGAFIRAHVYLVKRYREYDTMIGLRSTLYGFAAVGVSAVLEAIILSSLIDVFPSVGSQSSLLKRMFDSSWSLSDEKISTGAFVVFCLCKMVMTLVCSILPLPVGLYSPVFLVGALLGRSIGEAIAVMGWPGTQLGPAEFAVLGAASMTGGTFRAISTAVIVLEVTGQLWLQLPVAVAVVSAYFVANRLALPMYDVLTRLNAVPHIPDLPSELRQDPIRKWMQAVDPCLLVTPDFTVRDCVELLSLSNALVFPIVRSKIDFTLLGDVQRRDLERIVDTASSRDGIVRRRRSTDGESADLGGLLLQEVSVGGSRERGEEEEEDADGAPRVDSSSKIQNGHYDDDTVSPSSSLRKTTTTQSRVSLVDPVVGRWHNGFAGDGDHSPLRRAIRLRDSTAKTPTTPPTFGSRRDDLELIFDAAPFQVSYTAPLSRCYMLFHMLRLAQIYCVAEGVLVGVVTREFLMSDLSKKPKNGHASAARS